MSRLSHVLILLLGCSAAAVELPWSPSRAAPAHAAPKAKESTHEKRVADTPIPAAGAAAVEVAGPIKNAVDTLKSNLWTEISAEPNQPVIAILALGLGGVALFDGRHFFKVLAVACFTAVAFFTALSQLDGHSPFAKFSFATEFAVLAGAAAYLGWEGAQLVLGAVFGLYLFHTVQGLTALEPNIAAAAHTSAWILLVGSLCVAIGMYAVHDRRGGAKVLGLLAPLFGSTLVVASLGYLGMFACTVPDIGQAAGVAFKPTDVPCVFQFWNMIAFPLSSEAVGFFTATHQHMNIGKHVFDLDRVLSLVFSALFFFVGTRYQFKRANEEQAQASSMLRATLLQGEAAKNQV